MDEPVTASDGYTAICEEAPLRLDEVCGVRRAESQWILHPSAGVVHWTGRFRPRRMEGRREQWWREGLVRGPALDFVLDRGTPMGHEGWV